MASAPYRDNPFASSGDFGASGGYPPAGYSSNHSTTDLQDGVYLPAGAGAPRVGAGRTYSPMAAGASPPLRSSPWLEKQNAQSRRSKWIVIGGIIAIIVIAIGAGVGVGVAKAHSHNSNLASSGSGSSGPDPVNSNPNDPSQFQKNASLVNSFFGLAYTPANTIYPSCTASQADVITDIQLMSQLTTRVRLYGADCNASELVLNAIALTKVNLTVYLGNYIDINDDTAYQRQKAAIEAALTKFGTKNVFGVTVGNEVMLNYCTDNNLADASNDTAVAPAVQYITSKITDTRTSLAAMGFGSLPIGNADAGSFFNHQILEAVDYGLSNVHPWFATQDVANAAAWTANFFQTTNVDAAAATARKPQMYIAETGWPTASDDAQHASDGAPGPGGLADVQNLQTFLDTFVCQANANGTDYFFFEFFDEAWKGPIYGGVEAHWGLFTTDKQLKAITIPQCAHQ